MRCRERAFVGEIEGLVCMCVQYGVVLNSDSTLACSLIVHRGTSLHVILVSWVSKVEVVDLSKVHRIMYSVSKR